MEREKIDFDLKSFGKAIQKKREAYGFSQAALARKIGCSNVVISRTESGHSVGLVRGAAIAYFLEIDLLDFIVDGDGLEFQQKLPLKSPVV